MIYELIIAGAAFFHPHEATDSLGVETVNGKVFVIHKVDEKETLYAISRRYGASVDAILKSNPGTSAALEVGQVLKVPYEKKITVARNSGESKTHKVAPKETMYSIARTYGITVDDLRKWNNLTDNNLSVGQELIVKKSSAAPKTNTPQEQRSETPPVTTPVPANGVHTVSSGETLYSVARQYGIPVNQIRNWNSLENDELRVGQNIFIAGPEHRKVNTNTVTQQEARKETSVSEVQKSEPTRQEPVRNEPVTNAGTNKSQTIRISESLKNSDEIIESGVAELIEGTEGNRKYLALHRTAPVGTILKVRNEMNNREVFVRVMGKLPDTAVNDKLVIKLSRSAYDRLGAIDPRFRVELTYYK